MFLWLDKLDPKILNPFPGNSEKSKRELYYDHLTFAYYATGQYAKCIELCEYALNLDNLVGDSWFQSRISVCLNKLSEIH